MPASRVGYVPDAQGGLPQGPTYCTYGVRVPASGVGYVPRTVAPQAETIPRASPAAGVQLALYVGAFAGVEAPPAPPAHSYAAEAEGAVLVLTLELAPGTSWTLPAAAAAASSAPVHRSLYLYAGD